MATALKKPILAMTVALFDALFKALSQALSKALSKAKKNTAFGYEMRCFFMGFLLPENQSLYNQPVRKHL
jgi:hypothetical protein